MKEPPARADNLAHEVIGAAIEVHRTLGPGFLESVYYKNSLIAEHRLDLLIGGELVVELKAVVATSPTHVAQVLSYLKAGAFQLGLIINFNVDLLRNGIRRVVLTA